MVDDMEVGPICGVECAKPTEDGSCAHLDTIRRPTSAFELGGLLLCLHKQCDRCHRCREWMAQLVDVISRHIDDRAATAQFGLPTPEGFPILRGRKRALRLDKSIAVAASEAVCNKRFRSSSRMAAAGNIAIAVSSARSTDAQLVVDYVYAVRQVGSAQAQLQAMCVRFPAWANGRHERKMVAESQACQYCISRETLRHRPEDPSGTSDSAH